MFQHSCVKEIKAEYGKTTTTVCKYDDLNTFQIFWQIVISLWIHLASDTSIYFFKKLIHSHD